jgi:hypothetical protein
VQVSLGERPTPVTWIVELETPIPDPQLDVVAPAAAELVDGVDQPAGTAIVSPPPATVVVAV